MPHLARSASQAVPRACSPPRSARRGGLHAMQSSLVCGPLAFLCLLAVLSTWRAPTRSGY
eukprot:1230926-Prorocentrum_lima.AAC.1